MARAWQVKGLNPKATVRANGRRVVSTRLREARSYEPLTRDAEDVPGLHNMRIAVKRLRYSTELFRGCFGKAFKTHVKQMQHLQELLGDIHDCDVLVEYLDGMLEKATPEQAVGVRALRDRKTAHRAAQHAELVAELDRLRDERFWSTILDDVCA